MGDEVADGVGDVPALVAVRTEVFVFDAADDICATVLCCGLSSGEGDLCYFDFW